MASVPRPDADEFASGFATYVSRVADVDDAPRALSSQRERVLQSLGALDERAAEYRYAPEKWSIKELVGHISDAERIFAYRLLRIGRGDATPLAGFEEDDYVRAAGSHTRTLRDLLDEWQSARLATVTLVAGLPADAWTHRGTSNGHPVSARALLYIILGHVDHHLDVLATRYHVGAS